jgi:hypothetical protein
MSTQVQYRRGSGSQNDSFTGALGEITVDTTAKTIRVHDGATAGGSNIATVSYVTAQISALSANSISFGTSNVRVTSSGGNVTTSVGGTANVLIVTSTGANVTGTFNATGNITGGNILGGANVNATTHTGSTVNVSGAITGGSLSVSTGNIAGGNLLLSGAIEDSAQLDIRTTASNGNIVLTPNGTGNVNISSNVMPTANATANIGSSTSQFNTIFAKATSAQYADLAEMYVSDAEYAPGTVVEFGGTHEITISSSSHSTAVAGIVSTNPSYLMNSTQTGEHVLPVALTGRVPCRVQGPVRKGDVLVSSSTPGVAQRIGMNWQPGCVVGKAMEIIENSEIQTIEVAVGRL